MQRDGALTEYILMPAEKLYTANLTIKELCLVEPLTVGFHAVARARITAEDSGGGVWLWRSGSGSDRSFEFCRRQNNCDRR